MRTTTLSINGLLLADPDLLKDNLQLPDGVDADTAEAWIMREAQPFEVVYPDAAYMAYMISTWSAGRLAAWTKMYQTELLEYNPIENYNMYDHWVNEGSGDNSGEYGSTIDTSEAAFDGSTLKKNQSVDTTGDNSGEYSNTLEHTQERTGNIGTMTTQMMIEQERDIADFSIYKIIADEFKREFCIMIY